MQPLEANIKHRLKDRDSSLLLKQQPPKFIMPLKKQVIEQKIEPSRRGLGDIRNSRL